MEEDRGEEEAGEEEAKSEEGALRVDPGGFCGVGDIVGKRTRRGKWNALAEEEKGQESRVGGTADTGDKGDGGSRKDKEIGDRRKIDGGAVTRGRRRERMTQVSIKGGPVFGGVNESRRGEKRRSAGNRPTLTGRAPR